MPTTVTQLVAPHGVARIYRIAAGRLLLIGPAGSSRVRTSDDEGATWTARSSTLSGQYLSMARDGSTIVIIGSSAARQSTDNGTTWSGISGLTFGSFSKVFFLGGRWWAIGSNNNFYTSTTGLTGSWTAVNIGRAEPVRDMAYDPVRGRWVLVTSVRGYYSDDGVTWADCGATPEGTWPQSWIVHHAGTWIAPAQPIFGSVLLRSTDGISWSSATGLLAGSTSNVDYPGRAVPHAGRWVSVGYGRRDSTTNNTPFVWCSEDDGQSWSLTWGAGAPLGVGRLLDVAATAGGLVAAGYLGDSSKTALQLESADGIAWRDMASGYAFDRVSTDPDSGDILGRFTTTYSIDMDAATGAAEWYRISLDPTPPSYTITLPLSVERISTAITLPLSVQRIATGVTLSLPLSVRRVAPYGVTLPIDARRIDAAVLGGLDGAGSWAASPDGRWQAVVVLDGSDISDRILGRVSVQIAADAACTAEFAFVPTAALQPLALIGRPVRIAFAQAGGLNGQTLFTGVVDVPSVDLQTGAVTCNCHDQAQEVWANTPREAIDALVGGRWHEAVSGEPEDNFDYLEARIASVGASWALDPLQRPRVIPWDSAARTVTVRQADVDDASLSVDLPSRQQLRTRIVCRMQYRYTRLRSRGVVAQYSQPLSFFQPMLSPSAEVLRDSRQFLTADMVRGAASAPGGWELQGEIEIINPPVGSWNLGTGIDPYVFSISARVAPTLALGFVARYSARWAQTVTEDYTETVVWPALEAQIGQPVSEEIGASLEAEFDQPDWGYDSTVAPHVPGAGLGDAVLPWQPAGADRAACEEVRRTLLDQAWVRLWSASRSGRVRFSLPCRPDLWLDTRVTLEHPALRAAGLISEIEHALDMESGEATSTVTLAVGMPGATPAAHPTWTITPPPADGYTPPASALSFEIGTYVGGAADSPEFDPESMIGFVTNEEGPTVPGREYYPHQLSIRSPEIEAAVRDPLDLTAETTHAVAVPTDLLEIP